MLQIPNENQRLKQVIEYTSNGNISAFSKDINVSQPRIARLFIIDKRSGKYPLVSFDIVQSIINKFINIDAEWLLLGKGEMLKSQEPPQETKPITNNDKYIQSLEDRIEELKDRIEELKKYNDDKDYIIQLKNEKINLLQAIIDNSDTVAENIKNVG